MHECVLRVLITCPHAATCVFTIVLLPCQGPHTTTVVLILIYMCSHTTVEDDEMSEVTERAIHLDHACPKIIGYGALS